MGTKCKDCGMTFFPQETDCYKVPDQQCGFGLKVTGKAKSPDFNSKLEYGP